MYLQVSQPGCIDLVCFSITFLYFSSSIPIVLILMISISKNDMENEIDKENIYLYPFMLSTRKG